MSSRNPNDARERELRSLFNLRPGSENWLGTDAVDECERKFELKSTAREDGNISTARNLGPAHLAKWRADMHWLVCRGTYTGDTFCVGETYYLSPVQMEPFYRSIETKLTRHDPLINRVLNLCSESQFTPEEIAELNQMFVQGTRLGTTYLRWSYVVENGTAIYADHAERLREIVKEEQV